MVDDNDDLSSFRDGHWRVLPAWVKAVSMLVGLPSFIVLMIGTFRGDFDSTLQTVAFGAFAGVALLQMAFLFRAYWRMEL